MKRHSARSNGLIRKCCVVALALQLAGATLPAKAESAEAQGSLNLGLPLPYIAPSTVERIIGAGSKRATVQKSVTPAPQPAVSIDEPASGCAAAPAAASATVEAASCSDRLVSPAAVEADLATTASAPLTPPSPDCDSITTSGDTTERPTSSVSLASADIGSSIENGVIVIDNDEAQETEATIAYEELPTDEAKTRVKAGARFPVVISSEITSKTAKKGDTIQARLKYDLKIGDRLVASKGSVVTGHLNYVLKARSTMHSLLSPERWYRNSGVLGIAFDEIINERGEHIPLLALPARKARIVKNKAEGRELGVNHLGQVAGPWGQQLRYKAIRVGLNFALAPAGVFSFGAMPVALGVMGAVSPSFAFMKPVGLNVRHRRIKGFAWGFLSGIPGSWLIEDTVVKGNEAIIKPGDEFLAEMKEEFTGEPATDAMLMPGATTKVRGQVVPDSSKKK